MNRDIIEQILRDYEAFRRPDTDPELEAVRAAILIEDVFDVTLSDADIDQAAVRRRVRHRRIGRPPPRSCLMCGVCGIVSYSSPPDLLLLRRMMGRLGAPRTGRQRILP